MNLVDLSIRRPVFAWILMFGLIVFGAVCVNRIGISQMPDVDFPILDVSVTYEGAAPEVVETELIDRIEERLLSIEGVKEMRSSVRQGGGSIRLEFDISRNVDVALQEVQSAISTLRLPEEVDPPVVRKQNPEEDPIMIIGIYGDMEPRELINWSQNFLLDQLRFLPNVGEVSGWGFSQRSVRVWPDPKKMSRLELAISDILAALRTQHFESAVGQFVENDKEYRVRWLGEAATVDEVANIRILQRGGQNIQEKDLRIRDVAAVEDGLSDVRRIAQIQGKTAFAIGVRKQRGANEIDVAKVIEAKLKELRPQFPKGVDYQINMDYTKSTKATVDTTIEKLFAAAFVTIFICFLFLGSIQSAINILFSIPTSIVGTFIIVYFSGFTLNLFSLLALTLAISIVVDDAIMLLENIVRHFNMGKTATQAASEGSKEVMPAAIAATLAVIAIFIPVVFIDGVIGKFFFQFGITMSAAVLLSLLEAATITPMRAAFLMRRHTKASRFEKFLDHFFEGLANRYQNILKGIVRWKGTVVLVSTVIFVASLFLITKVRQEFVPAQDQDLIQLSGQAPPGTDLVKTYEAAVKIEEIVKKHPDIESYFLSVGAGGPSSNTNNFNMPLKLKSQTQRKKRHTEIMDELREQFKEVKGIRVTMRDISTRNLASGRPFPLSFNLRGPELETLQKLSEEISKRLGDEKLAVDLDTDLRFGIPELILVPNRKVMAERGVSIESLAQTLSVAVGGLTQGRFTADGKRIDIRVKIPENLMKTREDLKRIYTRNSYGILIPISDLVTIQESKALQSITRVNRQRAVAVFGNLAPNVSQAQALERARAIAVEIMPTGYSFALEGASAGFTEAFGNLWKALLFGILVAYMILAIQFNSFVHPVSVLMALPFSVTGALFALWLFGVSLNIFSFIGLIVLMGIAKKNSIMMVEFTTQLREKEQLPPLEALLKACPIRLRPILMTSTATVIAALPLVIGSGMGHETRMPMGLTIVGGTILSTLLTLFVVPCFYMLMVKLEAKENKEEARGLAPSHS